MDIYGLLCGGENPLLVFGRYVLLQDIEKHIGVFHVRLAVGDKVRHLLRTKAQVSRPTLRQARTVSSADVAQEAVIIGPRRDRRGRQGFLPRTVPGDPPPAIDGRFGCRQRLGIEELLLASVRRMYYRGCVICLSRHDFKATTVHDQQLSRQFHGGLGGLDKSVSHRLQSRQAPARLFRRFLRGNKLPGRHSQHADIPSPLLFRHVTGEGADSLLGDHIGAGADAFDIGAAVEVHNTARAARLHVGQRVFRAEIGSAEVGLYHPIPEILIHIPYAGPARRSHGEVGDYGGVIDQDVDAAEAVNDLIDHCANFVLAANIALHRQRLRPHLPQSVRNTAQTVDIATDEDDTGAFLRGNELKIDVDNIFWPRTLDMNDRALRHVIVGLGGKANGVPRETGFVITAASEVMAILALANSREDCCQRLSNITIGFNLGGQIVRAGDLNATGAMMVLLNEAIRPLYPTEIGLEEKVDLIVGEIYGASSVYFESAARRKLEKFSALGFSSLPVCMAKTQSSLSDDPKKAGAPSGWTLTVTDAHLASGAGFISVVAGNMLLMPGLSRMPQAVRMNVDKVGRIIGLS